MKLIPKYQKARKFNIEWIKDKDVNGNVGYRNIKTGQFRATVPNSQEERQQEQRKNNTAALKQYSADSVKYNRERATRKNHSDETVKKVISKPSLVMRNNGKTTIVRSKELAPREDSAKLNTTIEEQIPMFKGLNLVTGLGKLVLSKIGQNEFSHWARNSLLNETAGSLTKNVSKGITNNLSAKEYIIGDNPIMQLSYYKPTRKAWSTGKAEGNEATSYFFKQQPNQRFELVKDIEPNNYSVHFKTDRNGLSYGNKMQLFAKVADEVPEGANLSTWGSVSKGGIHGINRFGKDFGFIQNGIRQLTMKGSGEPVKVGIFQKPLNHHLQGEDAVKMFKEYGGTPIPEGSLNGDQLRKYVMEARERYGLIDNPNISDEEIAQALYKHTNELGKGSAAVNSQGEPQLLFRGDTKAYTQLKPRISPEELYEQKGTMDNSLGTLFLGEMPKGTGGDQGVAKYLNTATTTKAMPGTEAQTVFRPSQTGCSLEFDGKTWKGIYEYPSTIEKNTKTPVVVPEDASFLYSGKNGLYSVYKLPSRMATSGVNEINGFVVRTPAVRDMSYEMQVLEPAIPVQYADKFNWLTKSKPKLIEDKDGFPFIDYKGKQSSGLASGSEQGVARELYRDQYSQLLKEAKEQNQGLLYSKPNTVLRREHNNYSYYALPNWNLKNAKHILPYDLRIPRNWSDPNIFRIATPIGMSLPFLNNYQK